MEEIQTYLASQQNHTVIADLVEVESGKDDQNRPVLQERCTHPSQERSVSRLCRLSRDLEFVAGLMKSKVRFRMPPTPLPMNSPWHLCRDGNSCRKEIVATSQAAAKKRGVRLGTAGSRNIKKANEAKVSAANAFALKIQPLVQPLREAGQTFQQIADALNSMGLTTPQGKCFYPSSVRNYTLRFQ